MRGKVWILVGALLLVSLGAVGVAEAAGVHGTGTLWAKGVGYALVRGDGAVDIIGHGAGTVRVSGAEALHAEGSGRRWDLPNGTVVFAGWRGEINAEGDDLTVKLSGGLIEFTAQGSGSVLLKGRGRYEANNVSGLWTAEGLLLQIPAAPEML